MTSPVRENAKGLALVDELYSDRTRRAVELNRNHRKVIGYLCCFPPVEMITALDMIPFRIMGSANDPTTKADAYLETNMCSFLRSCFDLAIKGHYDCLDGLVVPTSCDTVGKVFDLWRYHKSPRFTHLIMVPHMLEPSSFRFFKIELQRLRKALEEFNGIELSNERLRSAIASHNENRALLRQLYELRKPDPPLISGAEFTRTLVACMTIPVLEANQLLKQVTDEVKHRKDGAPSRRSSRVLVHGSHIDDDGFIGLVESSDANVVADDLCIGTRHFWHDVELTDDPLDGIVNRYLDKIPCPRTYRRGTGDYRADMRYRFGYLRKLAEDANVNAVICHVVRFCDTHEFDLPDVRDYLEGLGYPVLHLEVDYNQSTAGQLSTRIQAFLEMNSQ